MKWIISICLFLSFLSCDTENKEELLTLGKPIPLQAIEYPEEVIMRNPWAIKPLADKLLLFFPSLSSSNKDVIKIMDAHTGSLIGHWGNFGNGPDEFQASMYWGSNDKTKTFFLYDPNAGRERIYHWSSQGDSLLITQTKEISYKQQADKYLLRGIRLENGNSVTAPLLGVEKSLLLLDNQLDSVVNFGDLPDKACTAPTLEHFDARFSAYGNKFIVAMSYLGYVACYEQQPEGKVVKLWSHYLQKPIYSREGLDLKQMKVGFYGAAMNENYIFLTYSGELYSREKQKNRKVHPETLLMFNHDGKLLRNFHTVGYQLTNIALSPDGKTLYAVAVYPEYRIVRFDLSPYI